jgi:hypothetical protein
MAVNRSRDMNAELQQGIIDSSYISITPDRDCVENPQLDRLEWPQYAHAEMWPNRSMRPSNVQRAARPAEFTKTHQNGTLRPAQTPGTTAAPKDWMYENPSEVLG